MSAKPLTVKTSAQTQEVATSVVVKLAMSWRPTSSAAKVKWWRDHYGDLSAQEVMMIFVNIEVDFILFAKYFFTFGFTALNVCVRVLLREKHHSTTIYLQIWVVFLIGETE